jgi:hypothetical protein
MDAGEPEPIDQGQVSGGGYPVLDQLGHELVGTAFLDIHGVSDDLCRAALDCGARRAVALLPGAVSRAGPPEIIAAELESWSSSEQFDVVHCASLHEMYDPIHALRRMVDLARGTIVLAIPHAPRSGPVRFPAFTNLLLRWLPAIVVGAPKESLDAAAHAFALSPQALRIFFEKHYACFMPATVSRSADRTFIRADFREIDTLTIVAGVTSSGKSTFLQRLRQDAELRRELKLPEVTASASPRTLKGLSSREHGHVLFHYDLLRPFGRALRTHWRDPALSILRSARRVNVLTIMTPQERLLAQLKQNEFVGKTPTPRHLELLRRYQEIGFLEEWHRAWFAFCENSAVARHVIVENSGTYRFEQAPAGMKRSASL